MKILIVLLGFSSIFYVPGASQFFPLELILTMVFLLRFGRVLGLLKRDPQLRKFLLFGSLWFFSQFVTDIVRGTSLADMAKGLSGIFFLVFGVLTLLDLCAGRIERTVLLIVGAQAGAILFATFSPAIQSMGNIWKWGYSYPALYLTAVYCGRFYEGKGWRPLAASSAVLALAAFSFLMNARSVGATIAATGFLLFLRIVFPGAIVSIVRNLRNPFIAVSAGLAAATLAVAFSLGMAALGKSGAFGQEAQVKWEEQDRGKYGFFLGGRDETVFSLSAIADSPIIGHGSWARDTKYRDLYWTLYDWGYTKDVAYTRMLIGNADLIPTHSHLFGAWVWAGFLGFLFWIFILVQLISNLLLGLQSRTRFFSLLAMVAILGIWTILFSPFGGGTRVQWEVLLPFVFMFGAKLRQGDTSTPIARNFRRGALAQ